MSVLDTLLRRNDHKGQASLEGHIAALANALREGDDNLEMMTERLAELELALEGEGWLKLDFLSAQEFSRQGLGKIIKMARLMYLKNPLINHAVEVQAHYVFGQGMTVEAAHPLVGEAVARFLDDPRNKIELTGHQARMQKEIELAVTGNLFLTFFTSPKAGRVLVRSIPVEEITDIICNPEDAKDPWYYKRAWTEQRFDVTQGFASSGQRTAYYPSWGVNLKTAPQSIGGNPVMEYPIYHIKVGGHEGMRFGVPEIYSALDWARAVKEDLEDFATIRRALSRFAWSMTTKGGPKAIQAAKTKLETTLGTLATGGETNPPPTVGSTFIAAEGAATLTPISTRGAGMLPDDARMLWLMVSAGVGIPETILAGNAEVGNLATAKTLDRPTELKMRARQELWRDVFGRVLQYVVDRAALANEGDLKGKVEEDEDKQPVVVLADDPDTGEPINRQINIDFPSILERDSNALIDAVVKAATLDGKSQAGTMTDKTTARLLLRALGIEDISGELEAMFPEGQETATEARFARALRDVREALVK